MNNFKFHSVGQGLFYTGSLAHGKFNFVYDCGTVGHQHYLSSAIDDYVEQLQKSGANKPRIDFVVISHLHKDHFSGLFELARKTNIEKVYLPYLGSNKNFISFILYYAIFFRDGYVYKKRKELDELYYFMRSLYHIEEYRISNQIESVFLSDDGGDA